jgi:hypothetical protein
MILGFSGTSNGLTQAQRLTLRYLFNELHITVLHHGDCIGADTQAHRIARQLFARVIIHQPTNDQKQARLQGDVVLPPKPYILRNHDIVLASAGVITCPLSTHEQFRGSGTWAVIRYTRKLKKPLWIIWPDGTFKAENNGD